LKNNILTNFLIDLSIKLYVRIFRLNGKLKLRYSWKRRIYKLHALYRDSIKKNSKIQDDYILKSKEFLHKNFKGYQDISYHTFYPSLNGIRDYRYIPEDIFHGIIEKRLNKLEFADAYSDKNLYERVLKEYKGPKTAFRVIKGLFYDEDYNLTNPNEIKKILDPDETFILKPAIDSGGGINIVFDQIDNLIKHLEKIIDNSENLKNENFIVQHLLEQHKQISDFHSDSINTFRVMTLRIDEKIFPVCSVLRMGSNGSKIDNISGGGVTCTINSDGLLGDFAYDLHFEKVSAHPMSGKKFKGEKISMFPEVLKLTEHLHKQLPYFDLISWDMSIGKDGDPYLIELNLSLQECNGLQAMDGPLFKEHTDAVIKKLNL